MKKIISLLLVISMLLIQLAACSTEDIKETEKPDESKDPITADESETPGETDEPEITEPTYPEYKETETGPENTLTGAGETITVNVSDNTLYITNLATAENNENKLIENSPVQLPPYVDIEGSLVSLAWEYVSAIKYENKVVNKVLTNGLIYKFNEPTQNLDLRVYFVVRPELTGSFEVYMEMDNLNETETRINLKGGYFSITTKIIDLAETNITRIRTEGYIAEGHVQNAAAMNNPSYINGVMYKGTGVITSNLESERTKQFYSERTDYNNNGGFYTAQYLERENDGVFVALGWTTGVVSSKAEKADGYIVTKVNLKGALQQGDFSTLIQPGDTFMLPSIYVMPYEGDLDDGSNKFKSWFFDCKVVPILREDASLPYVQVDGDLGSPEIAKNAGIDSVKWDYGWWSGYGYQGKGEPAESAWTLLAEGLDAPGITQEALASYGKTLDEYGLNFTTYILLHDSFDENGQFTDKYGEFNSVTHPEWFSNCVVYADLGNVECVEYLKTTLEKFFKLNNVDQWRTDFQPIAYSSDKKNRHDANGSDVVYWCAVGFREILTHLYETVDGFKYESCSSGGGDKDLFNAEMATFFNCDDTANYLSLRASFYDSSYVIHPAQLEAPCFPYTFDTNSSSMWPQVPEPEVAEGDDYNFHEAMMDMGFRSTIQGIPMWSSNVPEHIEYYTEYSAIYKNKVKPLVRDGELYHILPRPDGTNWDGIMYADPDSENEIKGVVFLFKPSAEVSDTYNVVFDGLYEDTLYQLTFEDRPEQNKVVSGSELMTNGIDVEIKYVGSEMIWITECE